MRIGAVADVREYVLLASEWLLAKPHRPFAPHMRSRGCLVRINQRRHPMATDASERPASFGHWGRTVVRATGAEAWAPHRRGPVAQQRPRAIRHPQAAVR